MGLNDGRSSVQVAALSSPLPCPHQEVERLPCPLTLSLPWDRPL